MNKKRFNWDWLTIAVLILAFAVFFKGTLSLKYIDSRVFPMIVLALVAILTIFMIVKAIREPTPEYDFQGGGRAMCFVASLLIYAVVIYVAGFYIASPVYMAVMMYLMGQRNKKVIAGVSLGVTLFIFVTFDLVMHIPVPTGMFLK